MLSTKLEFIAEMINKIYGHGDMSFVEPFCRNSDMSSAMDMPLVLGCPQYIDTHYKGNEEVRLCDYDQLDIPRKSLIYCDPPDDIAGEKMFNYEKFYRWCDDRVFDDYHVLIFDYVGRVPPNFIKIRSVGHVALYCHSEQKEIWGLD